VARFDSSLSFREVDGHMARLWSRILTGFLPFTVGCSLVGCQQQSRGRVGPANGLGGFAAAFVSTVEGSPGFEDCAKRVQPLLDSQDDAVLIRLLILLCDVQREEYGSTHPDGGPQIAAYFDNYDAAWISCVYRLGDLGRAGDDAAIRQLISLLGLYDAHYCEMTLDALARVGKRAIPFLREVQKQGGLRARLATDAIDCIEHGGPF
jgi:hypothetical protein